MFDPKQFRIVMQHAAKTSDNKNQATMSILSTKAGTQGTFQFADQRSGAVAQRKLLTMADQYAQQLADKQGVIQRVEVAAAQAATTTAATSSTPAVTTPSKPAIRTSANFDTRHLTAEAVTDDNALTRLWDRQKTDGERQKINTLINEAVFVRVVGADPAKILTAAAGTTLTYKGFAAGEARTAKANPALRSLGMTYATPEIKIAFRNQGPNLIEIHHLEESAFGLDASEFAPLPASAAASAGAGPAPAPSPQAPPAKTWAGFVSKASAKTAPPRSASGDEGWGSGDRGGERSSPASRRRSSLPLRRWHPGPARMRRDR
jgi:hypothetical protein